MKITISFRNVKHSEKVETQIAKQTSKLDKYLNGKTSINWNFVQKDGLHYAEAELIGPQFEIYASAKSENLYKSIDAAVSKLEKQLKKKKEILRDDRKFATSPIVLDPEIAWLEHEDEYNEAS